MLPLGDDTLDADHIVSNLRDIEKRIAAACQKSERARESVRLLLATKTVSADRIRVALEAGATLVGENKVQEFIAKSDALADLTYERHYIGHLQSNKIKQVLRYVNCIQSIDSVELARKLQDRLEFEDRTVDILVQVNTSYEASKFGVDPDQAEHAVREIARFDRLRIRGLMTIGLLFSHGERARRCFVKLRQLREQIEQLQIEGVEMQELSMGMSPDFEEAIAEGATTVRIGMSVFGRRPTPDGYFWKESDR